MNTDAPSASRDKENRERYRRLLAMRKTRIDMIPLLDIIFILLIFLIMAVAAGTPPRGLALEIPEGRGAQVPEFISIEIDREGNIFFEDARVTPERAAEMAKAKQAGRGTAVVIRGDKNSRLGSSVTLLSRLEEAGLGNVFFEITEDD